MIENRVRHNCRFDVEDPRFKRVQKLFARRRPDEARAILRELVCEWQEEQARRWSEELPRAAAPKAAEFEAAEPEAAGPDAA